MFIGHFAVGFGCKAAAPRVSLGTTILASQLLDLLWPLFLLVGWEEVRIDPGNTAFTPLDFVRYPISHSLAGAAAWATLLAAGYWLLTRYRAGTGIVWACVVSHWVLDALTHRPDLPLYPGGSQRVGLGLWSSIPGTLAVESALFAGAVWAYLRGTRAVDRIGSIGLWSFVGFLVLLYAGMLAGPPPPSARAIALTDLASWVLPLWAWWFDAHRAASEGAPLTA